MSERALVAMSGGVDSSVAALLIKRQGFDAAGVTLKLFGNEDIGLDSDRTCCSLEDVEDARSVAYRIGIPYFVFNFSEYFKEKVISRFIDCYARGITPNPCVDCNRFVKFDKLSERATLLGYDYIVTGHYAIIEHSREENRYYLKKGSDPEKDQSYVLYMLNQKQLSTSMFPLGGMHKSQVRRIAEENGFINAGKRDSQDICFVRGGGYAEFIRQYAGLKSETGNFVNSTGEILGTHRGIINYTVGQRRGLNVNSAYPLYVCGIDAQKNEVILGAEAELYGKSMDAGQINLIAYDRLTAPVRCRVKIRYRQAEQPAVAYQTGSDRLHIEFDFPQKAITKGQTAVLYDGDYVVGGGVIL